LVIDTDFILFSIKTFNRYYTFVFDKVDCSGFDTLPRCG
jgi:hypothetical protein